MSAVQKLYLSARITAELRADLFNVTNTPHFANPTAAFGNPLFGRVTSTLGGYGNRQLQLAARLFF